MSSNSTRNVLDQQPSVVSIESDIESSGSTAQVDVYKRQGYYHVTAAYEENGIRDEKELDGARLIGDCMAILPVNRNWIFTQTHNLSLIHI